MKIMKSSRMNIIYLQTYSPQFSPVEFAFWIFKKNLFNKTKCNWIQLGKVESFKIIKWALSCLNKDKINGWFRHFCKVVKDEINL